MNTTLSSLRDNARAQLWPLPALGTVLAVAAAVALPHLDAMIDASLPGWVSSVLFGGDASAARTLLNAISTSLITVTSLTFSLTVVTLQLASSQFSPRLLRTFTSDVFVQATLAILLAAFSYALTLLRAVRSADSGAAFVPRISVTVAFALAVISVLALVLFLAHLARQIRVETMLRDVHAGAIATVNAATTPRRATPGSTLTLRPRVDALRLNAARSGFITSIDESRVLAAAQRADAYLVIDRHPGCNVVEGVPIGCAWTAHGTLGPAVHERLQRDVAAAIGIGYERTAAQDLGYGLRQLTDVASKALSPGINDPTTAIHAIGHISAILCQLAGRDLDPAVLRDDDGHIRVMLRRPSFSELLDEAVTQPRRYGAADPQVIARLFCLLEELAWHVTDRSAVLQQLDRLLDTVGQSDFDQVERDRFERAADDIRAVSPAPQDPATAEPTAGA